ncbi:hypothetical protein U1Q18_005304, partial [Sarracenia purpurea var. burkii]
QNIFFRNGSFRQVPRGRHNPRGCGILSQLSCRALDPNQSVILGDTDPFHLELIT